MDIVAARRPGQPELYPTAIKPYLNDIEKWLSEGSPEYAISKKLGISTQTWIEAKKKYIEFSECVARSRVSAGSIMIGKQFSAACGQLVSLNKQKVTKDGEVIDIKEEVYIPPNTNAADLWGRNMLPDYIQAKQDSSSTVTVTVQLPTVQAEISRLEASRLALEAELATIELLPDVSGAYARPGADCPADAVKSDNSDDADPFSHNCTA